MRSNDKPVYRKRSDGSVQRGYRTASGKIIFPADLNAEGENGENGKSVSTEETQPAAPIVEKKYFGMKKKTAIIVGIGLVIIITIATRKYHKLF